MTPAFQIGPDPYVTDRYDFQKAKQSERGQCSQLSIRMPWVAFAPFAGEMKAPA